MLEYSIPLTFRHRAFFTRDVFADSNDTLKHAFDSDNLDRKRILCVIESAVAAAIPELAAGASAALQKLTSDTNVVILNGGEEAKNNTALVDAVHQLVHENHIDRHSFILCIGGGAFLDAVGFGAATAHRGIRLIRLPSTTLAQCDSGVGVKNGINQFGKKNFTGSFAIPWAIINDSSLLATQPVSTRHIGLVEALKVALIKDARFFEHIADNTDALNQFDIDVVEDVIQQSAKLHMEHIATAGDPFELGSSRPLDFGHWSAHKLEQLTGFTFSHAEAVSVGVALDVLYSAETGLLPADTAERILGVMEALRYPTWHDDLLRPSEITTSLAIFDGLTEFREHLGGDLTVMMLTEIGQGKDVHEIDGAIMETCIQKLRKLNCSGALQAPTNAREASPTDTPPSNEQSPVSNTAPRRLKNAATKDAVPCSGALQAPTNAQQPSPTKTTPPNQPPNPTKRTPRLSRLDKITIDAPIYFVTTCTQDRRRILANDVVHAAFKKFCETGIKQGVWVGKYVIMPDHLHLFVAFDGNAKTDISKWMRLLKRQLTIQIRKTQPSETIWQKGFFDHVLRSDESYAAKWQYVLENPTRANLVSDSADWPYTGEITPLG